MPVTRRRGAGGSSGGAARSSGAGGAASAGILKFYTDDSPGLRIGPTAVLVLSLLFIGFVIILHVWGKFRRN